METTNSSQHSYWYRTWRQFRKHYLGVAALYVVILFVLAAVYAPFLASSKPIFVIYDGEAYFPLFRYLFYTGFFTKALDIFFNLFIVTLPLFCLAIWIRKYHRKSGTIAIYTILLGHFLAFFFIEYFPPNDPAGDSVLNQERHKFLVEHPGQVMDWKTELNFMDPYAKLNLLVQQKNREEQNAEFLPYQEAYAKISPEGKKTLPTLWQVEQDHINEEMHNIEEVIKRAEASGKKAPKNAEDRLKKLQDKRQWINEQTAQLHWEIMPLLSHYHWQDDAGGQEALNRYVPWWQLTRINRKDLLSALIFGIRISIIVGIAAVGLALLIGIPVGAFAGYYGGTCDIIVSRLLEIWESMPTFFMLLMIVAVLQNKSIFLVIAAIGLFGWTGFSRYIRGEFFKQRSLPYVEACHALGFKDGYIMFKQILPNAIPPVLALLPFAIMGAITSEAGLSFLGLGEEGSCSWGVLMDEGRTAFPAESYLLWPPAILLTIFLVAIALVGDSLRDAIDPKLYKASD